MKSTYPKGKPAIREAFIKEAGEIIDSFLDSFGELQDKNNGVPRLSEIEQLMIKADEKTREALKEAFQSAVSLMDNRQANALKKANF